MVRPELSVFVIHTAHEIAMEECARALAADDPTAKKGHLKAAFRHEAKAARLIQNLPDSTENQLCYEPTRSILFLSAANLAKDIGKPDLSIIYAAQGLEGCDYPTLRKDMHALIWENFLASGSRQNQPTP